MSRFAWMYERHLGTSIALSGILVVGVVACHSGDSGAQKSATLAVAAPAAAQVSANDARRPDFRRAAFLLVQAENRWSGDWPKPEHWTERSCPSANTADQSSQPLTTRSVDSRWERKTPLPMALVQALATPELTNARELLSGETTHTAAEPTRVALSLLSQLERQNHAAVFHVVHYEPARVVHRIDKIRPEWLPGVFSGWLAIHRIEDREPLCQTQITAHNPVIDAPLSRRLRPHLTAQFERELWVKIWLEAKRGLARIGPALQLPKPPHLNPSHGDPESSPDIEKDAPSTPPGHGVSQLLGESS